MAVRAATDGMAVAATAAMMCAAVIAADMMDAAAGAAATAGTMTIVADADVAMMIAAGVMAGRDSRPDGRAVLRAQAGRAVRRAVVAAGRATPILTPVRTRPPATRPCWRADREPIAGLRLRATNLHAPGMPAGGARPARS